MKKSLTIRYLLQQCAFWAAAAGVISFASAFLLDKGFSESMVGILLAAGNLLSCAFQPVLADRADRIGGNVIKWLIVGMTCVCVVCFGAIGLLSMPMWLFGLLYLLGIFFFDAMNPLLNALSVSYNEQGFSINYGLGRGIGSFAYALAALGIGKVMAGFGAGWMIWISLFLLAANIVIALGYPSLDITLSRQERQSECCSIPVFFSRYRFYCASLLGVMLLGMFHAMTENYMIRIVEPLGGDSGTVGVALFIATTVEMFVLVKFDWIRRHLSDTLLLKLAGLSFLLKAGLFLLASNVTEIYLIQLLQTTSYSFLAPTQLYYAHSKVRGADMVKGQAFITAAYTLGCAAGNFAGGQLIGFFGVTAMLVAGVGIAAAGTLVLFLTVNKKDAALQNA